MYIKHVPHRQHNSNARRIDPRARRWWCRDGGGGTRVGCPTATVASEQAKVHLLSQLYLCPARLTGPGAVLL